MTQKDGFIWFDGQWLPWQNANVHVLTHSLHYGMGIFEGLRAYPTPNGPAIFRLQDHTDRFYRSAHIMNMTIPFDKETLNQAQCDVIIKNNL
ncbi:MAG TPA: aminotransferase class IV, partial [Candidatus Berkiella sp.]|nr:aminotransferase class IV [Candidatus Berkiella sp.]